MEFVDGNHVRDGAFLRPIPPNTDGRCPKCGLSLEKHRDAYGEYISCPWCGYQWEPQLVAISPPEGERLCEECGEPFEANRPWQRLCSDPCRNKFYSRTRDRSFAEDRLCPACEETFTARHKDTVYCSPRCRKRVGMRRFRERNNGEVRDRVYATVAA